MLKRDFNLLIFRCGTGLIQDIFTRASYPQFEEQLYLTSYIHPSTLPVNKDLTMIYSTELVWKTSQVLFKSNLR